MPNSRSTWNVFSLNNQENEESNVLQHSQLKIHMLANKLKTIREMKRPMTRRYFGAQVFQYTRAYNK